MGYNRSGCLSGGAFSLYFLLLFAVVLPLGFCFPFFSLIGVIRRGGQQVRATQTVLVGVGWVGIVGHFSADAIVETQHIVGLEGTKLCFYDTLIITSLLDTSVITSSHCHCR
jgi:hypothetical protein